MANFVRTDAALQPAPTSGRRPIVLARIPHASENEASRILPFADASSANLVAVDEPPPVPPLPPRVGSIPMASDFVDHRHVARETPPAPSREPADRKLKSRRDRSRSLETGSRKKSHGSRSAAKPSGLYKLHSQVAPYSGAIVALALLLSAGLLYWMIAAPNRAPNDFRSANYGSFEASTAELPNFSPKMPSYPPEDLAIEENEALVEDLPWWETENVKIDGPKIALEETPPHLPLAAEEHFSFSIEDPMPLVKTPDVVSAPTPDRVVQNRLEPISGPSVELVFPSTSRPEAIDFSKWNAATVSEPPSVRGQQKPRVELGKRPLSRILTPIKG